MDPNIAMAEEEGPWENRREENGDLLSLNSEDGKGMFYRCCLVFVVFLQICFY